MSPVIVTGITVVRPSLLMGAPCAATNGVPTEVTIAGPSARRFDARLWTAARGAGSWNVPLPVWSTTCSTTASRAPTCCSIAFSARFDSGLRVNVVSLVSTPDRSAPITTSATRNAAPQAPITRHGCAAERRAQAAGERIDRIGVSFTSFVLGDADGTEGEAEVLVRHPLHEAGVARNVRELVEADEGADRVEGGGGRVDRRVHVALGLRLAEEPLRQAQPGLERPDPLGQLGQVGELLAQSAHRGGRRGRALVVGDRQHQRLELVHRALVRADAGEHLGPPVTAELLERREGKLGLGREVEVEATLGEAALADQVVERRPGVAVLQEGPAGDLENALPCLLAPGDGGLGHGRARYRPTGRFATDWSVCSFMQGDAPRPRLPWPREPGPRGAEAGLRLLG